MDLDDMKEVWAAHGAALERSLVINERLLRETMLRKVRFALAPYILWRALEVVLGVAVLLLVVPVVAAHLGEARYLVAGGLLVGVVVAITAMCCYLLIASLRLDHGGPVTTIQRDVAHLKRMEYRATMGAVLGGVVIWLPAALVLFEAVTGVDALARVELRWLLANLAFGLVVLAIGIGWSRRHVDGAEPGYRASRIIDAVSGRSLRAVDAHLAELAAFQRDEDPRS